MAFEFVDEAWEKLGKIHKTTTEIEMDLRYSVAYKKGRMITESLILFPIKTIRGIKNDLDLALYDLGDVHNTIFPFISMPFKETRLGDAYEKLKFVKHYLRAGGAYSKDELEKMSNILYASRLLMQGVTGSLNRLNRY